MSKPEDTTNSQGEPNSTTKEMSNEDIKKMKEIVKKDLNTFKKINENLIENYNTIDSIIQNEKKIKEKEKDKAEDIDKEIKEWEKIKEKQLKFENSLQELKAQDKALEKNFNK